MTEPVESNNGRQPKEILLDLHNRLSLTDDEAMVKMIWATRVLQSNDPMPAGHIIRDFPKAAMTSDMMNDLAIYPWYLETLTNELFSSTKHNFYRFVDCRSWNTIADFRNLLWELDGAEFNTQGEDVTILKTVNKIIALQLPWQRSSLTISQLYRNIFIYGQGQCADYFESTHGLSINEFTLFGFGLKSLFDAQLCYPRDADFSVMGISRDARDLALKRLCAPIEEARCEAVQARAMDITTAYKPSVLRRYPCIAFGPKRRRIYAPLPDLIGSRITSGLFYDVVRGGPRIREEYGRRFEEYARKYLRAILPNLSLLDEWSYKVSSQRFDSPDIIGLENDGDRVSFIIECKAHRMSHAARFGNNASEQPGYDEMAKGVFQIWRFLAHCRLGKTGRSATSRPVGIVLTLDEWLTGDLDLRREVMKRAVASSKNSNGIVSPQDQCPIIFCSITDFENATRSASLSSFKAAVDLASTDVREGHLFSSVHLEVAEPKAIRREYPFKADLGELLPWWRALKAAALSQAASGV